MVGIKRDTTPTEPLRLLVKDSSLCCKDNETPTGPAVESQTLCLRSVFDHPVNMLDHPISRRNMWFGDLDPLRLVYTLRDVSLGPLKKNLPSALLPLSRFWLNTFLSRCCSEFPISEGSWYPLFHSPRFTSTSVSFLHLQCKRSSLYLCRDPDRLIQFLLLTRSLLSNLLSSS